MKRICVFCGSSPGARQDYLQAARVLGQALARRGITLVYGGASVGIMGEIARATLAAGGEVIGVITKKLFEVEVALTELPHLEVVDSMHERKAKMADLADGFIALPGGLGTMEEFVEILTWAQLGMHQKPCGLINVCGYYNPFLEFLRRAVTEQFIEAEHVEMILVEEEPETLLRKFETYQAPRNDKAAWALQMTDKMKKST